MLISVKEKRNLFPFNVWALGDITPLPNLNKYSSSTISYDKTTEYVSNGNYGLKCINTGNNTRPYVRYWIDIDSEWINKTIQFNVNVKTTFALSLRIYEHDGSRYTNTNVDIPENSEDTFTVTSTIASTTIALWIGIEFQKNQNEGAYFYTDNWCLKKI